MTFEFNTLEPHIHQILSAPGTDLATISAKRVRRQLLEADPSLTPEFLKENKEDVDSVIGRVFEKVSKGVNVGGSEEAEDPETEPLEKEESRKRRQGYDSENGGEEEDEDEDEDEDGMPTPKKAKKVRKKELSDAELARKLSNEINGRSRRTTNKGRSSSNGTSKRAARARKSAATVDSDGESSDEDGGKKPNKRKSGRTGAAKGGFAKEYALR